MGTTSYSKQNMRNDALGEWYQEIAAEFFSCLLKEELIKNHKTQGIDLIFTSQEIEVKGREGLFQCSPKKEDVCQLGRWKIDSHHVNRDTTLFAFVLFDEEYFPTPIIHTIDAKLVYERLDKYPDSRFVFFPLKWVKKRYSPNLSRLPWNSDPPVKYEFKHTNEIPELVQPPLGKTLAKIFREKNYSLDELEFLQDFFIEFSGTSWSNNPLIVEFIASIEENLQTKSNDKGFVQKRSFSSFVAKVRNFFKL